MDPRLSAALAALIATVAQAVAQGAYHADHLTRSDAGASCHHVAEVWSAAYDECRRECGGG